MDFLIVLAMSILTPFYFNINDVDYDTTAGISVTNNSPDASLSLYHTTPIKSGKDDYKIISTTFSGPSDISYEPFIQFKFNTGWADDRLFIGTRTSWKPLMESVKITMQAPNSLRPKTSQYYFYEMPAFGGFVEFDLIKMSSNKYISTSVSPYFGFSLFRAAYAGAGDYEIVGMYDGTIKLFYGVNFKTRTGWNLFIESSIHQIDFIALDAEKQNFTLTIAKIQSGFSYTFLPEPAQKRIHSNTTYQGIIEIINPNIAKVKQQEDEALKQAKIDEKEALKKAQTGESAVTPTPNTRTPPVSTSPIITPATPNTPAPVTEENNDWNF